MLTAAWNFASLQWVDNPDGVCNQIEHGGYSLGWLAMLLGDFPTANSLFDLAERAWDGREDRKSNFFQYYPVYFSEMYLIEDGDATRASRVIQDQLVQAQKSDWPETEARCHIMESLIQRHQARQLPERGHALHIAEVYCDAAEVALKKIFAPPVEVELLGELLCVHFEHPTSAEFSRNAAQLLERFDSRVSSLEWNLYRPELLAFKGLYFVTKGQHDHANKFLKEAEKLALSQRNVFAILSPYRPINMLRTRLGPKIDDSFTNYANSQKSMINTHFNTISNEDLRNAVDDDFKTQPS